MKVWVMAVVVVAMAAAVEAQFRFPRLPTPPQIFFGGFRPLLRNFLRPRPRPRPPVRPFPPFAPQARIICSSGNRLFRRCRFLRPENQRPPSQVFQSQPAPPPPRPQSPPPPPPPSPPQQVFQSQPPPRPPQQVFQAPPSPAPLPRPPQTQRPFVPSPPDLANFGAPRPDSILKTSPPQQPPQGPPRPPPSPPRPSPPNNFPSQGFPAPLPDFNDNNIIGMSPPPPPPPRARPQPTTPRPRPPQPSRVPLSRPLTTALPQRPAISPQSNTVDELLVNPVPAVNAGVLPLANEKPQQQQLFPPLISL